MTPNPILKVLSTLAKHRVQFLLMGGQACVLYGAAEFSRDTDIVILLDGANLERLRQSLDELQAENIAVPPFELDYLQRGHAVHFRCHHPEASKIRLDVMARMRNVASFAELWARRRTVEVEGGLQIDVLDVPDLVQAKKTQRDKDWPMIDRLVSVHYATHKDEASAPQVDFWLREMRSPALLLEIVRILPERTAALVRERPLLEIARHQDNEKLREALDAEEQQERVADKQYWSPLRRELEQLRWRR